MSDSVRPHRRQPIRLPRTWDSPGKNTGVDCHFLLQCMKVKSESEVAQSCPTLCNPIDSSPPGSSVHGIFQARVLEWGAIFFSAVYSTHYLFQIYLLFSFYYSSAVLTCILWVSVFYLHLHLQSFDELSVGPFPLTGWEFLSIRESFWYFL